MFWRRFDLCDNRGVSAIEFAMIAPMLVLTMLYTFDLGNLAQQKIWLTEAVRAGGAYASIFPTDTAGITNAVTGALNGWKDVTVTTPAASCLCWSASGGANSNTNSCTACSSGQILQRFVTLNVSRKVTGLFLSSTTLSASYVVQVQ
jgi:Flp pilus assembly protein TadG